MELGLIFELDLKVSNLKKCAIFEMSNLGLEVFFKKGESTNIGSNQHHLR
jgi:hypothetical protein